MSCEFYVSFWNWLIVDKDTEQMQFVDCVTFQLIYIFFFGFLLQNLNIKYKVVYQRCVFMGVEIRSRVIKSRRM